MISRQFNFSVSVGAALMVLGALLMGKASSGIGLIAIGLAILALSLFNRKGEPKNVQPLLLPVSAAQAHSQRPLKPVRQAG